MNITFLGSTQTSYKRGKDKTKRKYRGLLAAGTLGALGGAIGSRLAQTGLMVNHLNKKQHYLKKLDLNQKVEAHRISNSMVQNNVVNKRFSKVFRKAKLRGGAKGAAIGAGLGLGVTYLVNKLRKKND